MALARALAPRPEVLLLDEPLSALDYKLRKEMQSELKRLQAETGITFIFVTHDQEEALTMSDRVAVMSLGKILQVGSPREIYSAPADRFVASFIGDNNFLEATTIETHAKTVRVQLTAGGVLDVQLPTGTVPDQTMTVIVRPENASLGPPATGQLTGVVEGIVYFGADTHIYVKLPDGTPFLIRQQNATTVELSIGPGQQVFVKIAAGTARLLKNAA